MPSKAIPPARDRLQSRILVSIVAPLIFLACAQLVHWRIRDAPSWNLYLAKALGLSAAFALAAWALRAATPAAALIGGMICLLLTCFTGWVIESPAAFRPCPIACTVRPHLPCHTGRQEEEVWNVASQKAAEAVEPRRS